MLWWANGVGLSMERKANATTCPQLNTSGPERLGYPPKIKPIFAFCPLILYGPGPNVESAANNILKRGLRLVGTFVPPESI